MSEQIMWAVKGLSGEIFTETIRDTEEGAARSFAGDLWEHALIGGYRCIRVRVTEVQDE